MRIAYGNGSNTKTESASRGPFRKRNLKYANRLLKNLFRRFAK